MSRQECCPRFWPTDRVRVQVMCAFKGHQRSSRLRPKHTVNGSRDEAFCRASAVGAPSTAPVAASIGNQGPCRDPFTDLWLLDLATGAAVLSHTRRVHRRVGCGGGLLWGSPEDAAINWIIPAAAIAGALLMGAMPRLANTREHCEV